MSIQNPRNPHGYPHGGGGKPPGRGGDWPTIPHNPTDQPAPGPGGSNGAFDILKNFFEGLGIQFDAELESVIKTAMLAGYGPDQIDLIMPDLIKTKAFNNRFPGWAERTKNGYNQLNIGEYLQLENQYHRIMQQGGLPAGFYDQPSDFGSWIANNVSPDEIQGRVSMAVTAAKSIDPTMRNIMAQFYGLSTGDIASYFLDQNRALPVIERQYNSAGVASWAAKNGLNVTNMQHYENLVDSGLTVDQAAQGYGTVRSLTDTVGGIASTYGDTYSQTDAEKDVFFGQNEKRRRLIAQEAATFGGSSQGNTGSAKRQSY